MRRAGGNNKAHHQKRSRQDAGGVQGEADRRDGSHQGCRCQPRRRVHRGHMAAELVRHLRQAKCPCRHGRSLRTYTHATRQKQDEAAQTMGIFMMQVM